MPVCLAKRENVGLGKMVVREAGNTLYLLTTRKTAIANMDINGAPCMWCVTAI